jgi:sn-glycerol 3-phosphate transport system ATP-binding protein
VTVSNIVVQNVSKLWGASAAVKDVSFEAEAGAFLVRLGPSGCGKSTTLRLIAGLEQVSGGNIFIGGKEVTNLPPAERRIAMVFQSYALFPHLTVAENILFGLRVRKTPAAERQRRLDRVVSLLGLGKLLDRRPSQLSGGQQQRVALGRAIIAETSVCLMDEPLSNLDAQWRAEMRYEIRALQQKLGMTMVYVTHDQSEAMSMADKVILMREGQIEQAAAPDKLYVRPQSVFAARFVGTPPMNLLTLDVHGNGVAIRNCDKPVLAKPWPGLLLGVRPEHVKLSGEGYPARVVNAEFLGADTVIACVVGDQQIMVRVPGKAAVSSGATVPLAWEVSDGHFFDAASGRRRDDVADEATRLTTDSVQSHVA